MTRLLDAFIPWFARVQDFARAPHGSLDDVVQRLDAWFAQARAAAAGHAPEHAELAAYAAAAWADERLQTSSWDHATAWNTQLLQRRHFGVVDAGDGFFRHLHELGPERQEVREVFALALLLGLRGRHALDDGDEALQQLRDAELRRLVDDPRLAEPLLVDSARQPGCVDDARLAAAAPRPASQPRRARWLLASLGVLVPGLVALACHLLLRHAIRAWPGS